MPPIEPATLTFTEQGVPYSPGYDDIYHASAGGLEQARHVFLAGNDLPRRWQERERFVILETGFGQGLNFLATWAAWKADGRRCGRLHFLSVEKHPFRREDLARLHRNYPELAPLAAQLRDQWPELTAGFHRLEFEGGRVVLTLALGDALEAIPQFVAEPDALYLDGFAPAKNAALWSPRLLAEIGLLCRPGTTLATWAVAGAVRQALNQAGFALEKRPGFAHKREMLVGRYGCNDAEETLAAPVAAQRAPQRQAIVVGAGLAGSLCAEALTRRGWTVDLFERHGAPAEETSGNRTAVMLPMLSLDDNRASRLNRACYLHALRQVAQWQAAGAAIEGEACGVLQIARDAAHRRKQQEILERCGFPASYVRFVEQDEASLLAGMRVSDGGWWFGGGAWWNPPSLCRAALELAGPRLRRHFGTAVAAIEALADGGWRVLDATGRTLSSAPHLVLASAHDLLRLPQSAHLPLFRFRGQVSHLPAPPPQALRAVVCREGYVSPARDGLLCVGASFQRNGEAALTRADQEANRTRLSSMLPDYVPAAPLEDWGGRVGFRPVSPDKLPMLGLLHRPEARPQGRDLSAVERWPGLHVASGYGARGLVWSVLMGELLTSQIEGEPLPLEAQLAATVDPARFLLRQKFETGGDAG
ncbi:bifunctional tRNA (5-methylaminomethyl-2-thiouridine)(34)-methyltransferase MnmD/FAD-dependent 5-carboxymethylaminomethyl-2-thiouridine(34) oxidoreductase MnmC [Denitratisoma sp. DHT3]|uniref:bifunctional tRNA (5-methylaminomethyl-2-thiouridine)(34)-methyltransferase MnmD/FAD-dependent 5-carboxymethylaminomethyl-2-thiouridine(34) oxidoreductase MnmC n=1 Tax=Denitratisoma sp. DHT3 TaxID=1981880 RepID=UPI0011986AD4|nr:bifunctional tRNA (5-methylaminomethyl-2-thiouridine)(34)-methyltransferase MnmD/FAD-dependent 5-carboxymethylaminomethyl-2-thiouridine(34) oxidoreductase MnmC [Denitratisoma sp. DHT3]QDX79904.1 bifunctional tRNA (5-methylaminomethyl-2-thiouridine)(34)-methyltransferase MnmD/FAD-dependent 5-carboxymethylaminomethyl-2-thiouridine(34) oxidoreductase MnmC [Denitratisoma sp. DHT3]